jgi:hypothetical protein
MNRIYCNSRLLGYTRKGFIHLEKDQRRANRKRPTTFHMFTCMFICRVILLLVIRARTSNKILTPQSTRPAEAPPPRLDPRTSFRTSQPQNKPFIKSLLQLQPHSSYQVRVKFVSILWILPSTMAVRIELHPFRSHVACPPDP